MAADLQVEVRRTGGNGNFEEVVYVHRWMSPVRVAGSF
jgi:hypothetical protein